MMQRVALSTALVVLASGCLSQSHIIPKRDLAALAQTAPEERGREVRVVQAFEGEDKPPEQQRVSGGTSVVVVAPVHSGGHHHHRQPAPRRKPSGGKAKDAKDKAWVWVVLAAAVGIGLAASEGARYDGWVELHPMHPVHLYGPNGEYTWMPLAHVDPETAAWASKAIVRPSEGPWRTLRRRPLSRAGWTYAMTGGYVELPSIYDTVHTGAMFHIQPGYFFSQTVGLVFDFGLGAATNSYEDTITELRNSLELQIFPVQAGKLHGGVFGQIGIGARLEDDSHVAGTYEFRDTIFGAGAQLQIDLTTRLALTGRAGTTKTFGEWVPDIGIGLSVY